jgi:hypothetical protein
MKSLLLALAAFAVIALSLPGCGGGGGSEISTRHFEGLVHSSANHQALPSVELRLLDTDAVAISGEDGAFRFDTHRISTFYELDVAGYSFAQRVNLLNIPPLTVTIFLVLHLDLTHQHVYIAQATATLIDGQEVLIEYDD